MGAVRRVGEDYGRSPAELSEAEVRAYFLYLKNEKLQHILPKGFVKVRYYGLFAPGQRLGQARQVLARGQPPEPLGLNSKYN